MFLGVDLAHWEFIGLVFGLSLGLVEMSGWEMNRYLRHGIGILGVLLAGACVVLLFGFSGATLRSPVSFRWPVVVPSDKPSPASLEIVRSQVSQAAMPTPAYSAELATLKDQNAKLKKENARLEKFKTPHLVTAALSIPSACPSVTQVSSPSKISPTDCDALTGEQKEVDSADQERLELLKTLSSGTIKTSDQELQITTQAANVLATEKQAILNLQGLENRLCGQAQMATPAPTGR
jgi:hypothetical protein